jgi:hypothetical protein
MLKKIVFLVFLVSFFFYPAFSCIQVEKEANVTNSTVESPIEVTINIKNNCNYQKTVNIIEFFEGEVIYPKDKIANTTSGNLIAAIPPRLIWRDVIVKASGSNLTRYVFRPLMIGLITIQPTQVIDENGVSYFSNDVKIDVDCNHNHICEKKYGENFINCPSDCPSGSEDGICDGIRDGKCDPDCEPGADPDCIKPICGNRICETEETQENCCKDCGCPSGYNCIENKCVKTSSPLIYLIFALILAILVAIVILQSKKFHPQS